MKKTVVLFVMCWLSLVTVTAQNVLQHIIKDQVFRVGLTDPLFVNLLSNFLDEIEDSGQLNKLENEWIWSLDWIDRVE